MLKTTSPVPVSGLSVKQKTVNQCSYVLHCHILKEGFSNKVPSLLMSQYDIENCHNLSVIEKNSQSICNLPSLILRFIYSFNPIHDTIGISERHTSRAIMLQP